MNTENEKMNSIHNYDDIIDLPRPELRTHTRMSIHDRAAQFMPFAALTGYSDVIDEVGRTTDRKVSLSEQEKALINRRLAVLQKKEGCSPAAEITFFQQDMRKEGGSYLTVRVRIQKIDSFEKFIVCEDGRKIHFKDILRIES